MGNNKNIKKMKKVKRCSLTGKVINPSDEVVLVKRAKEYVVKQGYDLVPLRVLVLVSFLISVLLLIPSVTAFYDIQQPDESPFYFQVNNYKNHIVNQDYYIQIYIFNSTSGLPQSEFTGLDTPIYILHSSKDGLIEMGNLNFDSLFGYNAIIDKSNFEEAGEYFIVIGASNIEGDKVGVVSYNFEVIEFIDFEEGLFNLDFQNDTLIAVFLISLLMIIAGTLVYYQHFAFASLSIIIVGSLILFSGINQVVGVLVLCFGIFIAFLGGNN